MENHRKDENNLRNMFIGLENSTHLAACSQSPMLKNVWKSLEKYRKDILEYGNPWELWSEKVDQIRSLIAHLIGANRDEIAITFSVSSAFSGLVSGLGKSGKKNIVTSDLEYPTTNYIAIAQEKNGWRHKTIKHRNGIISGDQYGDAIDNKTELATVVHVSSLNGFRQDLKSIGEICHGKGAEMYVDCYQSLGTIPLDVKKTGIDYMAGGMLKWLLGSSGIAFLYVRKDLAEDMDPSSTGWLSQTDPFKFGAEELNFAEGARRFESGTLSIPSAYASIEGIKTVMETGTEFIKDRIEELSSFALDLASDMGFKSPTPVDRDMRGGIVAIDLDHPFEMENILRKDYRIFTSARGSSLRIAPHFYNTKEDIIRFFEKLKTIQTGR
ncbi:aminotransferase class V-fold PLP-dependent enzyme [Oxyplasma meridianum]|uniref:Aminotransferase class V-fold PLP-dependent enzyme n=1 Tax=Oxyplasma meridianum TaxID=3073602 RepID=A0AAX4NI52_9ARCH